MTETSVKVEIFNTTFSIRCTDEADRDYLISLSKYVDRNMFEIARKGNLSDTTNIAILTALNIADELKQEQMKREESFSKLRNRTRKLIELIEEVKDEDS
ncbi:MAG: cell division protein ZapA [Spirochaetota bacterium]